ncbi:MAG: GAF domain-containing sensor histidine kinase [Acidimicrobiales bacterium]
MSDLIVGDPPPHPAPLLGAAEAGTAPPDGVRTTPVGPQFSEGDTIVPNRLQPFGPIILAVRWATTGVSIALAAPALVGRDNSVWPWLVLVLANTVVRTVRPLRHTPTPRGSVVLAVEIFLHLVAVAATGFWDSPLVLLLTNAVIVAGFARGFRFASLVVATSALAVSLPVLSLEGWTGETLAQCAQWTTLLLLGGVIAGYTRHLSGEATLQHTMALDRVARLADANALLANLHRVAQTLPASLDLAEVLDSTLSRLRGLVPHDVAVILLREPADGSWSVAARFAVPLDGELVLADAPAPANRALANDRLVRVDALVPADRPFAERSKSGMYVPLLARGRLIGLLAVEAVDDHAFSARNAQLLRGFVEPVALAVDNARWFGRIRTVGAAEERNRIARDLHDRIGQSLAYLGFEIDAALRHDAAGEPVGDRLRKLREDVRAVVVEVRDTLSDLRTDVGDNSDFARTAEDFAARLSERSGLTVHLDCDAGRRLPLLQEREMWRIAQEALVNVERHANATAVSLLWRCDDRGAVLEVSDNGQGLPARGPDGRIGRADSYGMTGMRERADSVGATLEVTSEPGEGTRVRCFLRRG